MRIDSSGNVGIGTSSPSARLDVNGDLKTGNTVRIGLADANNTIVNIGEGATGNKFAIIDFIGDTTYTDYGLRVGRYNNGPNGTSEMQHRGTGALSLNAFDAGVILLQTQNTERARIDSSGNLGIGTSSPTGRLGVAVTGSRTLGGAWDAASVLVGSPGQFSGNLGLSFDTTNGATLESAAPGVASYPIRIVGSQAQFFTAGSERMRIDSSGNVGIGTSSPTTRLQIGDIGAADATFQGRIKLEDTPSSLQQTGGLEFATSSFGAGYGWKISSIDSSGVHLAFGTRQNSASWTEAMRIDSSGNVGIGTSSPSAAARLDVSSTTSGFLPPRMTTAQRDAIGSPPNGLMLYNTSTDKLQVRDAGAWVDLH
jgi:hypothetical protein